MAFLNGEKLRQVYQRAKAGGYAFMANNIAEANVLVGLLEGYTERRSDLVVQVSPGAAGFAGGGDKLAGLHTLSYMVRVLGDQYPIGVFLNLDHCTVKEMDLIQEAIKGSLVSSIMIDASKEAFEDNVHISHEVVEMAKESGILLRPNWGRSRGSRMRSPPTRRSIPIQTKQWSSLTGPEPIYSLSQWERNTASPRDVMWSCAPISPGASATDWLTKALRFPWSFMVPLGSLPSRSERSSTTGCVS